VAGIGAPAISKSGTPLKSCTRDQRSVGSSAAGAPPSLAAGFAFAAPPGAPGAGSFEAGAGSFGAGAGCLPADAGSFGAGGPPTPIDLSGGLGATSLAASSGIGGEISSKSLFTCSSLVSAKAVLRR
jgi:hypothetical protein